MERNCREGAFRKQDIRHQPFYCRRKTRSYNDAIVTPLSVRTRHLSRGHPAGVCMRYLVRYVGIACELIPSNLVEDRPFWIPLSAILQDYVQSTVTPMGIRHRSHVRESAEYPGSTRRS